MLRYLCCDSVRREAVLRAGLNGIDYVEVDEQPPGQPRRVVRLYLLAPVAAGAFGPDDVDLRGGDRGRPLEVGQLQFAAAPNVEVTVTLEESGDCGKYFLRLVRADGRPPAGFDPILSSVELYFWPEENGERACVAEATPRAALPAPPDLDYTARDFGALRTLMLDRLRAVAPGASWGDPAELSTTLIELLASVGDRISYAQDAVATEAYLTTARQRISVRRHARLVGYSMHEGCNARAWVQLRVRAGARVVPPVGAPPAVPAHTLLFAAHERLPGRIAPGSDDERRALEAGLLTFRTMTPLRTLDGALDRARFYTWGARDCRLPAGATRATLAGHFPGLAPGDVLILAESRGRDSGLEADADPARRHAVRLTRVDASHDPAGGQLEDPPRQGSPPVTEIEWMAEDALPFALVVSVRVDRSQVFGDVSVAHGNVVLADHGAPHRGEYLGAARAQPGHLRVEVEADCGCDAPTPAPAPARFEPTLGRGPLTWAAPTPNGPASRALSSDPARALPAVVLESYRALPTGTPRPPPAERGEEWTPLADLLGVDGEQRAFVVEVDNRAQARLRFGDDAHGRRPEVGVHFFADYRIGNGPAGNVGAHTLAHVVSDQAAVLGATNPLPAAGGTRAESMAEARVAAPVAFRRQERAVTLADYAERAERHPAVQRAAASWRWTGSWRTVFLAIDRRGGLAVDDAFEEELRAYLEPYRVMGHDLEIEGPRYVDLDVSLLVCVEPTYFRARVRAALERVFSSERGPDGAPGFFHPDRFTFGQPVVLSELYAQAHRVAGVSGLRVVRLSRLADPAASALETGKLAMAPLEIARLDRSARTVGGALHGRFVLELEGGR